MLIANNRNQLWLTWARSLLEGLWGPVELAGHLEAAWRPGCGVLTADSPSAGKGRGWPAHCCSWDEWPPAIYRLWTLNILGGSDWLSLVTCPLAVLGKERECPTPGDWWCWEAFTKGSIPTKTWRKNPNEGRVEVDYPTKDLLAMVFFSFTLKSGFMYIKVSWSSWNSELRFRWWQCQDASQVFKLTV